MPITASNPFKWRHYPGDIILWCVRWHLRFPISFAHMAEMANIFLIPHSWSSDLLTAASLHLCAFLRRAPFVEFSTSQGPLSRALVREPLRMVDGYLKVPEGPGLGVDVNDEVIHKYRVA